MKKLELTKKIMINQKCDFCNKKIDFTKLTSSFGHHWGGNSWNFCSSECMRSHTNNKDRTKNSQGFLKIDGNSKCSICGISENKRGSKGWMQISFDKGPIENYCGVCSEKRNKDLEIQSEQTRLDGLRNQLQNPDNSAKRGDLESQIKETESHLNKLKQESKNQQQKSQLQQDITNLENKPNKTPHEEQDLTNKKKELEKLNNSVDNQEKDKTSWIKPVLIISSIILAIGLIIYLFSRNKKSKR